MGFPVGSRTTVQGPTQDCLTSVFEMRTGDPVRYGRPTANVKSRRQAGKTRAHAAFWKQKNEVNLTLSASEDAFDIQCVRMDVS